MIVTPDEFAMLNIKAKASLTMKGMMREAKKNWKRISVIAMLSLQVTLIYPRLQAF